MSVLFLPAFLLPFPPVFSLLCPPQVTRGKAGRQGPPQTACQSRYTNSAALIGIVLSIDRMLSAAVIILPDCCDACAATAAAMCVR